MKRKVQHALDLLRASAKEHDLPIAELTDEELLDAVALVCRSFAWEGAAPELIAAGHFKIGFAFADLWAAVKMDQEYSPRALGKKKARFSWLWRALT
jgi:hypothetical protein